MSLFPAYNVENDDSKKDNDDCTKSLSWLKNETCHPEIGSISRPIDSRSSLNAGHKNLSNLNETSNEYKKHKKKRKRSVSSSCRDVKGLKRKTSSKKDKKKNLTVIDSKFDSDRTYGNFEIWSNLLEKMKSVFLEDCGLNMKPEKAWFFSIKEDKSNRAFNVTPFNQRSQYKSVKGTLGIRCLKSKNTKKKRYFSKSIRKLYLMEGSSTRAVNMNLISTGDYVPLGLTFEEESKVRKKSNQFDDCSQNDKDVFSSELKYWQAKIKDYNSKLTLTPNDISLWLEFVHIQDKAFTYIYQDASTRTGKNKSRNLKAITERKIAILDSAIEKNINSLELKYERLKLGQEIWQIETLHSEWNDLICNFCTNICVWHKYLYFNQTYFPSFNLARVSRAYSTCNHKLRQISNDMLPSSYNNGYNLVDMAVHLAFLWCQMGYMERCIALMQALIELNFNCPENLQNSSESSKINIFEAFWDSKAPRFGEPESVGWATFMKQGIPVTFQESIIGGTKDEEDDILENDVAFSTMWINVESSRELYNWLPWQLDPDECEDPDRMVNFDCLRDHLFVLNYSEKMYLLRGFLNFFFPEDSSILKENGIFNELKLESLQPFILGKEYTESDIFLFPVIGPSLNKVESEKYFDFLIRLVWQMMPLCGNEMKKTLAAKLINLYKFRCKSLSTKQLDHNFIRKCRKEIKSILKKPEFRGSVELFYCYGLFEEQIGFPEDAIKIYVGAITIGIECGNILSIPLLSCLKSLIKIELGSGISCSEYTLTQGLSTTIARLILQNKLTRQFDKFNSSDILKAKRKLGMDIAEELVNIESNRIEVSFICYAIFLLVILEYLFMGFRSACALMENYLQKLDKINIHNKEILYEDYLWLIEISPKLHKLIAYQPVSRSTMREILNSALKIAPANITFIKKFAENQSWRDLLGFSEGNSSNLSVILRLLPHIQNAIKLLTASEGNFSVGHKIEHILESALKSETGKTCPLLWRLYLRVISLVRPNDLKSTCYQALHNCPGAKCIYLDCIRLVPDMLKEIILLMQEKKIRVRLPLEELELLLEKEED